MLTWLEKYCEIVRCIMIHDVYLINHDKVLLFDDIFVND